jgi:hypothetical protein
MSLINDALKKAQRQQPNNPFGVEPPMPGGGGGGRVPKRGKPTSAQGIVLMVAGGAVLIVLSVVGTVFLVNGKSAPKPAAPVAPQRTAATPTAAPASAPAPVIVVPKIEVPATITVAPAPVTPPARTETASVERAPAAVSRAASEAKSEPKAVTPSTKSLPDERVNVFLDALRITGIRSSGGDSRVMMNDHVYRVNDIVDRSLSLRLTAVASDHLTFTDSNGIAYDKNF